MSVDREALRARIARKARSALRLPRRLRHAAEVALRIVWWAVTLQLRAGLRRRADARRIRRSGLFERDHYLAQCPDDAGARRDPVEHYLRVGAARGLEPSPLFDGADYLARHPEVAAAGENPLAHHLRARAEERRRATARAAASHERAPSPRPSPPLRGGERGWEREPTSVLVVAARAPAAGSAARDPEDAHLALLLALLRRTQLPVTFASGDGGDAAALEGTGIALVRGRDALSAHLASEGDALHAVVLCGASEARRWLPSARAFAPRATVIYDRTPPRHAAEGGAAALDEVSARAADVVLVRASAERDAVRARAPEARVEVLSEGALREALAPRAPDPQPSPPAPAPASPAPDPEAARAGGGARSVLVLGVYLADARNNAAAIVEELARARGWRVEQRWVAAGRSPPPDALAAVTAFRQRSRAPKFVLLNRLLAEARPERHEFVLVCDDDISLPEGFLDRYLDLVVRYDLALAQPARTHGSYTDNHVVERLDGLLARRTRFVEIGPLFSMRRDAVRLLTPFDERSPMGWGYDFVWPVQIEEAGLRMGIVDAVPVAHDLRKPSAHYDDRDATIAMDAYLSGRRHLAPLDAFTVVESFA